MKLIFLDVDGVLNNGNWAKDMEKAGICVYRDAILHPDSLTFLRDLVYQTDARIVLSSSWRRCPPLRQELVKILKVYGLEIMDDTPYTGGIRGEDIARWLRQHPGNHTYVILDDDSDMLPKQKPFLVKTDFNTGFTHSCYLKALALLKGDADAQTRTP